MIKQFNYDNKTVKELGITDVVNIIRIFNSRYDSKLAFMRYLDWDKANPNHFHYKICYRLVLLNKHGIHEIPEIATLCNIVNGVNVYVDDDLGRHLVNDLSKYVSIKPLLNKYEYSLPNVFFDIPVVDYCVHTPYININNFDLINTVGIRQLPMVYGECNHVYLSDNFVIDKIPNRITSKDIGKAKCILRDLFADFNMDNESYNNALFMLFNLILRPSINCNTPVFAVFGTHDYNDSYDFVKVICALLGEEFCYDMHLSDEVRLCGKYNHIIYNVSHDCTRDLNFMKYHKLSKFNGVEFGHTGVNVNNCRSVLCYFNLNKSAYKDKYFYDYELSDSVIQIYLHGVRTNAKTDNPATYRNRINSVIWAVKVLCDAYKQKTNKPEIILRDNVPFNRDVTCKIIGILVNAGYTDMMKAFRK